MATDKQRLDWIENEPVELSRNFSSDIPTVRVWSRVDCYQSYKGTTYRIAIDAAMKSERQYAKERGSG